MKSIWKYIYFFICPSSTQKQKKKFLGRKILEGHLSPLHPLPATQEAHDNREHKGWEAGMLI